MCRTPLRRSACLLSFSRIVLNVVYGISRIENGANAEPTLCCGCQRIRDAENPCSRDFSSTESWESTNPSPHTILFKDDQEHDDVFLQHCMHFENLPRGLSWFSLESHRTHILRNIRIRSKHLSRWGLPTSDPLNWPTSIMQPILRVAAATCQILAPTLYDQIGTWSSSEVLKGSYLSRSAIR